MSETVACDALVVGGGIIGLSIARKFQALGITSILIEKNKFLGEETTSRNSGVIHSGIYYPKESLKSDLCIEGNNLIYEYCKRKNIPHRNLQKLIVGSKEDEEKIDKIYKNGLHVGVPKIERIEGKKLQDLEPNLSSQISHGILVPSAGIIDQHLFMESLSKEFRDSGGLISLNTKFISYQFCRGSHHISQCETGSEAFKIRSKIIVIACGLHSYHVGKTIPELDRKNLLRRVHFVKGHYFKLKSKISPFKRLIYPVPEKLGLGIHLTIDTAGVIKFGPDTQYTKKIDYTFSNANNLVNKFIEAISKYYPEIKPDDIVQDYTGIRPKLTSTNKFFDFEILTEKEHGLKNLFFLQGFESPGLTSSLSTAERIYKHLD